MGVPSFSDLGKAASDVLRAGYHYGQGLFKMTAKTKSGGNLSQCTDLSMNFDTSKMNGVTETKLRTHNYGTFAGKWTTGQNITAGYELTDQLLEGVKLMSEFTYNSDTYLKGIKVGATFANDTINAACAITNGLNSQISVLGSVVFAVKDVLLGYQGEYNKNINKMTKNDAALSFQYQDIGLHLRCVQIPYECGISLLYRMNPEWIVATNAILARKGTSQAWTMGAGAKYSMDNDSTLRFKFNTDLQLGMSIQQRLNDIVSLTLSWNVDCANVSRGGHKVGLALDIEA